MENFFFSGLEASIFAGSGYTEVTHTLEDGKTTIEGLQGGVGAHAGLQLNYPLANGFWITAKYKAQYFQTEVEKTSLKLEPLSHGYLIGVAYGL